MTASAYWVRVGGRTPLDTITSHGPPTYETLADGGSGQCTVELIRAPRYTPSTLRPGTRLEVMCGMHPIYRGSIQDGAEGSGQIGAQGIHRLAYTIPALDGGGLPTRAAGTAITTARSAPWSWPASDPGGLAGAALGTAPGTSTEPRSLGALLDEAAQHEGRRWGVNATGRLYARVDPTDPTVLISPDSGALGTTSDGSATHAHCRYWDGTQYQTLTRTHSRWRDGDPVTWETVVFDAEGWGTLTLAQATALIDGAFARTRHGFGWASGISVGTHQITTMGGVPMSPATVRAGVMAQIMDATSGAGWSTRAVIGRTRWTVGEDTIQLEPVGIQPRTLAALLAEGRAA